MRIKCRHGYSGKKVVDGATCNFYHPKNVCRKWMNNGPNNGGCKKGNDCKDVHVRICHNSLKQHECKYIGDGKKCFNGYHLKGTKACNDENDNIDDDNDNNMRNNDKRSRNQQKNGGNSNQIQKFLGELILKQLMKVEEKKNPQEQEKGGEMTLQNFMKMFKN